MKTNCTYSQFKEKCKVQTQSVGMGASWLGCYIPNTMVSTLMFQHAGRKYQGKLSDAIKGFTIHISLFIFIILKEGKKAEHFFCDY